MMPPLCSVFLRRLGYRNIYYLNKTFDNLERFSKINQVILFTKQQRFYKTSKLSDDTSLKDAHTLEDILSGKYEKDEKKEVMKVIGYLQSHGCTIEDIKKCLNYIDPNNTSYLKVVMISELGPDMSMLLPLMSVSVASLRRAAKLSKEDKHQIKDFPNRIAYLSHHLEVPADQLVTLLAKHCILLTMSFSKLDLKMNILMDANVSPESLLKDLWIFYYNENLLRRRISAAVAAGVEIKPWMLRSSPSIFRSILEKVDSTKGILAGDDQVTYLARKLECSEEYVKYIMEKNKLLHAINIPKLEKVFNFLFEKGYTPQEIRLFPRIFCSSVQSLEVRFNEAKQLRSTLPTVSQLCASQKRFKSTLERKTILSQETPALDENKA